MPTTGNQLRVLAITSPGPTQDQIVTALTNQEEFILGGIVNSLEKIGREIHSAEPGLILIDHMVNGQPTLDVIDDIALQFPEIPIVAILPEVDPVKAQQVTLAGARAFLGTPFTQVNLLSTLRRVRDLEDRRKKSQAITAATPIQESQTLRTLAVYSPRGGAGVTTIAANLAIRLHEESQEKVLLVDGKLSFGHLDVVLNIRSRNTIADLIPHANALDAGILGDVVAEHSSGIQVLLGPSSIEVAQGIRPEDLYNIINGVKRHFGYVVVDIGSALTENAVTLMDAADRVLLITAPELVALHDASRFIQVSRALSFPPGKTMVVLNRANLPGGIRSKDIESALHQELYAQIPDDGPNALRSLNRGLPLVTKYPRSPASQAITRMAKSLIEQGAREGAAVTASAPVKGKKAKAPKPAPATATSAQQVKT
jgi:pilus assembly protein CpaE